MAMNRKGAALAEVLIAVCAFSIAVPTVMSLYLISVARTCITASWLKLI